jgi:hypothetical protein
MEKKAMGFLVRRVNNKNGGKWYFYLKMGSVGRGRQVIRITGRLSCNKWTTGHLGVRWQVTVAKTYGRVTWRLVIGGKNRNKGLVISEKGKVLTAGIDSSYGMGHTREQVEQVGGDVHE